MGMDDFKSDPLWELLGRARRPEPSPWLATRIIAAARTRDAASSRRPLLALWRWLALPAGVAAIVIATLTVRHPFYRQPAESPQLFAAFEAFANNAFEADYLWSSDSF